MTPSEELLAIRERCAAEWEPHMWFAWNIKSRFSESYSYLHDQTDPLGPFWWFCRMARTRLKVVEMIERAAVAALKDEGVIL